MRALVILRHTLPLAVSFRRDVRRWILAGRPVRRSEAFHARRARQLLHTAARLGPSFVKLGQMFAGRADLIPEPYAGALSSLTDQVPPVPFETMRPIIEASLGRSITEVFERFDPAPIAAGSLGMVYRAHHQGEEVAVKVLRPGVRTLVEKDLRVARWVASKLASRIPDVHARAAEAIIEEFSLRVVEEMDFRREAENLRAVRANFGSNPRVRIPRVIDAVSSEQVLVLEYLRGTRIDQLDAARRYGGLGRHQIVERLIELYLQMMLVDGFFHADPHPGNLLVADDGALILLDFGLVIRVPMERRRQIVDVVFAALHNDPRGVVEGFYALGIVDPAARREQIERLAEVLLDLGARSTTTQERIDILSREILNTLYDWPIQLPSDLVYFARTASLIEGIGVGYDPHFNPINTAAPVLFRMRSRLMETLHGTRLWTDIDLPTALGFLLGRATVALKRGAERLRQLLTT